VISSWGPFVANVTNKPKLQDKFITPTKIPIGDEQSGLIFIGRNPFKSGQKMKTIKMMMNMRCLF